MKIRCKFKDPDTMHDSVVDAYSEVQPPAGISKAEWQSVRATRVIEASEQISDLWMEYGEYLDVEFDTVERTAVVLPRGTLK